MRLPDDGKKVKVINSGCCTGVVGTLSIIPTLAFVDFDDKRCSEGHIGVYLAYPFEKHYELVLKATK